MITRADYMEGRASHDEFYGEIADEMQIRWAPADVAKFKRALETDARMNNIPLAWWDARALSYRGEMQQYLRRHGDNYSLGGGVCILKASARKAAGAPMRVKA